MKKAIAAIAAVAGLLLTTASSCESPAQDKAQQQREQKNAAVILCGEKGESQECLNLKKKFQRDNDPNRITYVYLLSWTGEFIGYYVAKGKVSSNQSQMGPMDQSMKICNYASTAECYAVVEAPGDDGSFGPNEDGIFFFTADDTKITWNGLYQQSDKPLGIKVPLLYGS
jgi:hypothetical protein